MGIQIHIMWNWIPACAGMTSIAYNLTSKIAAFLLNQPHFRRKIRKKNIPANFQFQSSALPERFPLMLSRNFPNAPFSIAARISAMNCI